MPRRPSLRIVPDNARSPIKRTPGSRAKPCRHRHVEVDPRERRVTCVDCLVEVDPYEALDMLAQEIEQYDWARDAAERDAKQAQRELADLKHLERNAKARVRNAIRTLPECSCAQKRHYGRFCPECGGRVVKK